MKLQRYDTISVGCEDVSLPVKEFGLPKVVPCDDGHWVKYIDANHLVGLLSRANGRERKANTRHKSLRSDIAHAFDRYEGDSGGEAFGELLELIESALKDDEVRRKSP